MSLAPRRDTTLSIRSSRLLSTALGGLGCLALSTAVAAAEPGNVTLQAQTAESVTLANAGGDRVFVRVLKPNLLEVDYRPGNQTSPMTLIMDPGFAAKTWSPGTVSIADGASEVVLTTSAMVVRIAKSPCRVNVYETDGTTRIFGEAAAAGMTDARVKFEFDANLNWYGIQSAPSTRGREMGSTTLGDYVTKTFVTQLTRQNVTPAVDLNARWHGSETGPFAWTTGAASKRGFGVLWDNDGGSVAFSSTTLEMNKTNERCVSAVSSTKLDTLWFAMVGTPTEITQAMIELSGRPQMFPKYAQGFGNTEWGINEEELRSHINAYRSRHIPLDHFILDFDWKAWDLNDYGNFEWNLRATNVAASDFRGFPAASDTTLKTYTDAMGVKLMGITKPRLHVDTVQGAVITAGAATGATWRNAGSVGWWLPSGSPSTFKTDYWGSQRGRSDKVGNLNFFIPAARAWYAQNSIDRAFDKGIVGYWHDEGDEGPDSGDIPSASNFYNPLYQEGIYTYQRANKPGTRVWSMNRHSYLGSQRYGYGVWSGDISTDWRTLKTEAPRMLQTINAGMARTGTDAGGTAGSADSIGTIATDGVSKNVPTDELYARWLQFAAMQPTFRIHGVYLINRQPWFHGSEAEIAATEVIRLRSRLMPYIYAHDRIYSETGVPFVQPLVWDYPKDANVAERTDAWMFGRALLAAPILEPRATVTSPDGSLSMAGTTSKSIYLPAGTWYDYFRGTVHAGGATFIYPVSTSTLRELPLFIKKGAIIPSLPTALDHVAAAPITTVRLDMFPDTALTSFTYYDDDGVSYQYESGTFFKQAVSVQQSGSTVTVAFADKQGGFAPALQHYLIAINKFSATTVAGFTSFASQAALEAASGEGYAIGSGVHGSITYIKVAAGSARTITATGTNPGLGIATTTLPAATRNAPYDAQLGADGLGASSTWSVTPALPAGLVLDARTGRITGAATVAGSTSYTFQVSSGATASKALTLTVTAAPLLAHEAFPYTSGAIDWNGQGGENGFAEPWNRLVGGNGQGQVPVYPASYVAGLSAFGVTATGGAVQLTSVQQIPGNTNSQKNPEYARRLLTGFSDGGSAGANAWISFIGKGTTPGTGYLGVGLFNGNTEKMFIGQRFGMSNWGVEVAGGGGSADSTSSLSSTAFVVVNIRVLSGSSREVRLWVNPTPGTSAPSDAGAALVTTGTELSFDTLRLRGDSMVSKLTVDELRVGASFADISGVTVAHPTLQVSRAGNAIGDGGSDVVVGSAAGTAQALTFVLTNSGSAPLSVTTPVTVSGMTNCSASVTTQPGSAIGTGATSDLVVTVTPTAVGAWSLALAVVNTDSNATPYDWTVTGTAGAVAVPGLAITRSGTTIADGGTDGVAGAVAGSPQALTYVLANSGGAVLGVTVPVTLSGVTNCTATVTTQPAASIPAGGNGTFVLTVTPTVAGPWSCLVSITNTDVSHAPYDWTVSGTAQAAVSGPTGGSSGGSSGGGSHGCGLGQGIALVLMLGFSLMWRFRSGRRPTG